MKHPFDRGILFPPEVENKRLTAGLPPEEFRPKTLVIPLKQGIGEACVPVVEPGQGVKAGELVRKAAAICGGTGGGKPESAMGGGKDVLKLDDALASVDDFVAEKLGI